MDTENESVVYETQPDDVINIGDDNGSNEGVDDGSSSQMPLKRAHLIGLLPGQRAQGISLCPKVKKEEREKMKKEELDAQKIGASAKKTSISIIPTITQSSSSSVTGKRSIAGMFDTSSRSDVDAVIARCFYANGLPFNLARSPFFYDMIRIVNEAPKAKIRKGRSKQNTDSDQVRKTVLDEDFWEKAKFVLSFTKPIWLMIPFCDSDKSVIGVVYPKMRIMLEKIKAVLVDHVRIREAMEKLVISRWEMMNRPLHSLAYVLNPYFHSQAWLGWRWSYVAVVYLGIVDKIVRDPAERLIVRQQIGDFLSNKGPFARPQAIADQEYMSATTWWGMYGLTTNWDVFANNDNLDFDNEGVEDREYRELFSVDDTSLEPTTSQAQGSSRDAGEGRRQEITRGKRPYPG
ncbi:hypothetical protein ACHQM5_015869 [Ranunculus cassubicifolius]